MAKLKGKAVVRKNERNSLNRSRSFLKLEGSPTRNGPSLRPNAVQISKKSKGSTYIAQAPCVCNVPVHLNREKKVIRRRGAPVFQLSFLRKLIKRRIYFDRVKKSCVLFERVQTRFVKDIPPVIIMPSAATEVNARRLLTLAHCITDAIQSSSIQRIKSITKV